MKYIVEVREPVPSNLGEIADKVAASFHITEDKALALLHRAPGAVTRAVSEREADVVAGIFRRAGLNVVKRPVEAVERRSEGVGSASGAPAEPGGPVAGAGEGGGASGAEAGVGGEADGGSAAGAEPAPAAGSEGLAGSEGAAGSWGAAGVEPAGETDVGPEVDSGVEPDEGVPGDAGDVWDAPLDGGGQPPLDAFSRREGFDADGAELSWTGSGVEPPDASGGATFGRASRGVGGGALDVGTDDADDADDAAALAGEASGAATAAPESVRRSQTPEAVRRSQTPETVRRSQTPETMRRSQTPETVRRSETPETMRKTLTRGPGEATLQRGGLRRRVALAAILPAVLTLVVMVVAMAVTVMPLLRSQQQTRASDAARSEASALAALTGGVPLDAQSLQAPLIDAARRSQAALAPSGVRLMVVTDPTGKPLAGWYGPAVTPAAMPAAVRQRVAGLALAAVAGQSRPNENLATSLRDTWHAVLAMLGAGAAADVYGGAPVMSGGQAIGAVVVGVPPAGTGSRVASAFLTTVLVGLVPVLVAILVAMGLTRGLRGTIQYLLQAADRISRGDLEEPVSLESRDELGQLARAIERMRVSLQEGMERLRRRR